jgi:hypothetical protein
MNNIKFKKQFVLITEYWQLVQLLAVFLAYWSVQYWNWLVPEIATSAKYRVYMSPGRQVKLLVITGKH